MERISELIAYCGVHNVSIAISPSFDYGPSCYEIRMSRGIHHVRVILDMARSVNSLSKELDYILDHHLFVIEEREKSWIEGEKNA